MTTRTPSSLVSSCALSLLTLVVLTGRAPANDSAQPDALRAAIESARSSKRALVEKVEAEEAERDRRLAAANAEIVELAERQAALQRQLDEIRQKRYDLDVELDERSREETTAKQQIDSFLNEVTTQALALSERLQGSLLTAEVPSLRVDARALVEAEAVLAEEDEATAVAQSKKRLGELLGLYERVIAGAYSAGSFRAPVKLATEGAPIDACEVLRCGLVVGFYHHEESGESGLLLPHVANEAGFLEGQGKGLSSDQRAKIAAMVREPSGGGYLPFDVSGGAGVATLGASDSLERWFEKGGFFMWPLLVAAALALLVVLERGLMLTLRSRGLEKKIQRLLDYVRADRYDEAEAYAAKIGGSAGAVFQSALSHRDRDRSVLEDAVQEALLHQTPIFQKRLAFIALCAAIAPLIGLLGTVTGMIETFKAVTLYGTSDPRNMAGGIATALITTQAGLYLAIPCLLSRGILGAVADSALGRIETGAMSVVLTLLKRQEAHKAAGVSAHAHDDDDSGEGDDAPVRVRRPAERRATPVVGDDEDELPDLDLDAETERADSDEDAEERLGLQGV